jgi:hypothetical protein
VTLTGIAPPIWRRLVLPGDWSLDVVHDAIQAAMGWDDKHLHLFVTDTARYGVADEEADDDELPEDGAYLGEPLITKGDGFVYRYDFGDDWAHDVTLEELVESAERARCLDGERACPPEDCGGPHRYTDLLAALADPAHPEHEELRGWAGAGFDPERFDLDEVNGRLARLG